MVIEYMDLQDSWGVRTMYRVRRLGSRVQGIGFRVEGEGLSAAKINLGE